MLSLCPPSGLQLSSSRGLTTSASQARRLLCQAGAHHNVHYVQASSRCASSISSSTSSPAASTGNSCSNSSRSRAVVCQASGRPMWARGTPDPDDGKFPSGSGMSAIITNEIINCSSAPELETVLIEHGGSFSYINAAAAITRYAKLPGRSMASPLFSKLAAVWLQRLPEAEQRQHANVLWACSKLGSAEHPIWAETWRAYLDSVEKDLSVSAEPSVQAQELSSVLYACAKLRKQPQADELLLLLDAFVHPDVLPAAAPQAIANVIWALGRLSITPGWEAAFSQEQQLFAPQLLQKVAVEGTPQAIANVLVGLARMGTGPTPVVNVPGAQQYAGQLLSSVRPKKVSTWGPQDVAQAATACAQLQHRDERFMALLVQRAGQLLQPGARSRGRPLSAADKASGSRMLWCHGTAGHASIRSSSTQACCRQQCGQFVRPVAPQQPLQAICVPYLAVRAAAA